MRHYPTYNKRKWCGILYNAAKAPSFAEWRQHVESIVAAMPLANDFINDSDPRSWANSLFPGQRWGEITNNIAESWNSWVREARSMPVVAMIDHIRQQIMTMMNTRRQDCGKMKGELCTRPDKVLTENYLASRHVVVKGAAGHIFEVKDCSDTMSVDLLSRTCSCRAWQMARLPCSHGIASIESTKGNIYQYCDRYFSVAKYWEAYRGVIHPVPTSEMVLDDAGPLDHIQPPVVRVQPGRRKMQRYPSQVHKQTRKCKACGRVGHNKRTCKGGFNMT